MNNTWVNPHAETNIITEPAPLIVGISQKRLSVNL